MPVFPLILVGLGAFLIFSRKGSSLFGPPSVSIPDSAIYGFDYNFDVQGYLSSIHSELATTKIGGILGLGGTLVSQIITDIARQNNIKPQYILVVLQREQGLLTARNITQSQLDWAAGYGVPDSGIRDTSKQGFDKQILGICVAANEARVGSGPYANARGMVGKVVHTNTGDVIPQTLAAAMMLIYTPHSEALVMTQSIYSSRFPQVLQA